MMKLHLHFPLPGYGFLKVCQVGLAVFEAYVAVTFVYYCQITASVKAPQVFVVKVC